jgi:SAM-dependent methyltransferase
MNHLDVGIIKRNMADYVVMPKTDGHLMFIHMEPGKISLVSSVLILTTHAEQNLLECVCVGELCNFSIEIFDVIWTVNDAMISNKPFFERMSILKQFPGIFACTYFVTVKEYKPCTIGVLTDVFTSNTSSMGFPTDGAIIVNKLVGMYTYKSMYKFKPMMLMTVDSVLIQPPISVREKYSRNGYDVMVAINGIHHNAATNIAIPLNKMYGWVRWMRGPPNSKILPCPLIGPFGFETCIVYVRGGRSNQYTNKTCELRATANITRLMSTGYADWVVMNIRGDIPIIPGVRYGNGLGVAISILMHGPSGHPVTPAAFIGPIAGYFKCTERHSDDTVIVRCKEMKRNVATMVENNHVYIIGSGVTDHKIFHRCKTLVCSEKDVPAIVGAISIQWIDTKIAYKNMLRFVYMDMNNPSPFNIQEHNKTLGDVTYDAVVINHALHYAVDLDDVLLFIAIILKPGGKLYVLGPNGDTISEALNSSESGEVVHSNGLYKFKRVDDKNIRVVLPMTGGNEMDERLFFLADIAEACFRAGLSLDKVTDGDNIKGYPEDNKFVNMYSLYEISKPE